MVIYLQALDYYYWKLVNSNCYILTGVPKNIAVILTKPLNLIFNDILIDR